MRFVAIEVRESEGMQFLRLDPRVCNGAYYESSMQQSNQDFFDAALPTLFVYSVYGYPMSLICIPYITLQCRIFSPS